MTATGGTCAGAELMEIEVAPHVGAEKYEPGSEGTGECNGVEIAPGTPAYPVRADR